MSASTPALAAPAAGASGRKPVELPAPDNVVEAFSKQWQTIAMAPTTSFWVVLVAEGQREELQVRR